MNYSLVLCRWLLRFRSREQAQELGKSSASAQGLRRPVTCGTSRRGTGAFNVMDIGFEWHLGGVEWDFNCFWDFYGIHKGM